MIRFWKKIHKTNTCWLWTAFKMPSGYGQFRIKNRMMLAHRVSWELKNGPILDSKLCVLHKCDNPPCVNPDHLFLGTLEDNIKDMMDKKRNSKETAGAQGEQNGRAKLTEQQVKEIRSRPIYRGSQSKLAKEFEVSINLISRIINRKIWKYLW